MATHTRKCIESIIDFFYYRSFVLFTVRGVGHLMGADMLRSHDQLNNTLVNLHVIGHFCSWNR